MNRLNKGRRSDRIKVISGIGRKPRNAPYRKPNSVMALEAMAMEAARKKHPTCPFLAPRIFRDDSSNGLTRCIVQYILLVGGFASRINNQGTYRTKLGRYTPGTSRRGIADVIASYKGLSLHIEVKIGKDKQSAYQRQIEVEVTRSGGYYFIAKNFTDFKYWLDNLLINK